MSLTRIAVPENATILKGSLRNLLDGSSAASVHHTAAKVEQIHSDILDDNDSHYDLDEFTQLLDPTRILVMYNRDYFIFNNRRENNVDFIIVGHDDRGYIARGYNVQEKDQVFGIRVGNINTSSVEDLLESIWRDLPTTISRSKEDSIRTTGVLCFEKSTGNMLIPNDYFDDEDYVMNVAKAGFTLKPVDNVTKQAVNSQTSSANAQTTENKGNNTMSKVTAIVAANKSAAATAAKLEAGKVALTQLTKVAAKALPSGMAGMFAKQYLDTPVGRVVVANLLNLAIEQYAPNNQKARIVAKAAMDAAMLEVVQSFNISEMIDKAIEGINIDALTANISEE